MIVSLQSEIDALKQDLLETRQQLGESKQKCSIYQRRNESMLEQLSNAKHQAEVAESMLRRKERRVLDLETQLDESLASYDRMKFDHDKLKLDLATFKNDKLHFQHENERLLSSYETLSLSFKQYKQNMNEDVNRLNAQLARFISNREQKLNDNLHLLANNQPELNLQQQAVLKNSKRLELLYSQKYEKVHDSLILLCNATKQHGESTAVILDECEDVLKQLNRNESVLGKISDTNGPLTDQEKIEHFKNLSEQQQQHSSNNNNNIQPQMEHHRRVQSNGQTGRNKSKRKSSSNTSNNGSLNTAS